MDNLLFKSGNTGQVNIDQAQGIVECFVAGIGNKDSVGDIVISGAFAKSLTRRKPRVVWGHSWNDPIGKVLEMYEVSAGDSRLPAKMRNAGIGGLYAKVQFNLNSEKGKEAFATVAFFGEEQEWSIGYKTIDSVFDPNLQANILKEVELYEVSPVLHGANQLTGTISIKGDEKGYMPIIPMPGAEMMAPQMPRIVVVSAANLGEGESSEGNPFAEGMSQELSEPDKNALQAELAERTGSKIEVMNATENSVVFKRTTSDGKTSMYRLPYHREGSQYMFGKPEPYEAAATQPQPQQNIEQKPGAPVVVPNGGIAYRSDDQQEMLDIFGGGGVQSPWGKSDISHLIELPEAYMTSAKDFLGPVLRHHKLTGKPNAKGIVVDGLMTANALDALQNAVKALGTTIGQAGGNIGQAIGRIRDLAQTFNPYALDGDGDGFVQDGSAFMRPFVPIKKPGFDLPDVRGKKRSGDALLDKPRRAPKLPKDKAKWTREQRNEALLAGMMEPETREDVAFLANKRPDNEGIAKYWDMSEADLTKEGNKLVNARRQATGADKEKLDEELLKVSHEFQRRAAYAETFGQEFVPPAKREAAPTMVPEADKPKAPRAAQAEMSDEEIYNERMTGVSLAEMAERLGISREEVRQREQRHMRELRDREEQRRLDRQADDALDRALEGYIERYGEDAEPPTSDSGFASAGKVFDSLNREQIRNGEYFRDWDDLDDDEKLEMFQEVQYDYLYENYGNLGDDGLVDAMEDPKYDDEIYEYAEEVYDEIKARRTEDKQRADERAEDQRYAQSEAGRAEAAEDERVGREVYAAEYEEERAANEGLSSRGNRSGEFGSNPEDSKAAQVFDAILKKYWSMWGFDAPDKDDEGFDEPFGFSSRGKDEEVKQNKLDELVGGVRDRLIAELETADPATWKPSWRDDSLPMNPITGKPYRGWNAFWLMFATHDRKYGTGRYAGFNQLKERGAIVRKGEKGVPILRPQLIKKEDEDGNVKEFLVFRGATVFNIDQTDGGDESLRAIAADLPESERLKILDDTLAELGVNVRTQNMTPHYDPTGDYVSMPEFAKGTSAIEWSSTLAHETVHWTGGASRLNRPSVTNYGTSKQTRAYEELVAEIGSAMLLAAHGIEAPFRQDHAPYIKGWIQLLKDDPTALERAFKDAQAALNYMLEKSPNLRKLFGGLDNGKKKPEVDAPDKINVPVGASEGFASLHRVRTPGSEALAGILYDDNSGELMVGFLKGKAFDDLSSDEQIALTEKAELEIRQRRLDNAPVGDGDPYEYAKEMYEDARDVGWYVYSGVTMDDVQELAAARSKGRHINALKKVKQARKASDEDQFNFFGRTERIQDVARAKSTDGFAARGVPRGNENISITKDRNGYWVMTAMVTGGRGASEENRGTRLMHYTVVGGSRRDALKTFRDAMKRDNLSFAGEDGFASRGDALRPGVLESIQNNRNLRQVVGNDSRDVAALYMGYLNWHKETEDNDGDTGGFLGSPESVNAFIELIRDGESTPYVPFENMYDANSVRIANELANEIDRYNDFVKREYAFAPKRIEGLASRGTKRLGIEPRYQDQDWINRTQQRILRSGLDFQSLPESDRIDWANSFLDEYLNQNEMGHNLADVSNGRRISSRPDIDLMNYAEDAFNRMSDAHVRRRAQFGEEAQGLASVGRRTRRLGTKPSDAVDYVAWDPETESLFVAYKRGDGRSQMYVYEGVNSDEALAVENADSLGKAINAIKRAKNVRQATPEEVMGLADTDRREASETKKRLARLVLEETRDALKGMEVEFLSDTEMDVSDGAADKIVRVEIDPDTLEFRVSKVGTIYGDRETPDEERLYDTETAFSAGEVRTLAGRFLDEIQKDHDEQNRLDEELVAARRELDESGDAPGVESIDVSYSSALDAVDYNPTTKELRVTYKGGGTYIYEDVDSITAEELRTAPSKGRAMNEIKRAHSFRKDSEWSGGDGDAKGIEEFDVRGSEAVERVTYDPVKEELTVVYNGGRGYVYSKVTRAEADAVRSAPSKGRAINDIKRTHDVRKAEPRKAPDFEAAGWTKRGDGKWGKGDYEIEPMFDEAGNFTGLIARDPKSGHTFEQESHPDVPSDDHLESFEGLIDRMGAVGALGRGAGADVVRDPAPAPSMPRAKTQRPPRGGKRVRNRNVIISMEHGTLDEIIEAEDKGTTVDALRAISDPGNVYTKGPRKGMHRGPDTITVRDAETGELLHSNEILLTSSANRGPGFGGGHTAANRKRGYIRARSYAGRQDHNIVGEDNGKFTSSPNLRGADGKTTMTESDQRVYGLGSDEKNREYGLASRGSRDYADSKATQAKRQAAAIRGFGFNNPEKYQKISDRLDAGETVMVELEDDYHLADGWMDTYQISISKTPDGTYKVAAEGWTYNREPRSNPEDPNWSDTQEFQDLDTVVVALSSWLDITGNEALFTDEEIEASEGSRYDIAKTANNIRSNIGLASRGQAIGEGQRPLGDSIYQSGSPYFGRIFNENVELEVVPAMDILPDDPDAVGKYMIVGVYRTGDSSDSYDYFDGLEQFWNLDDALDYIQAISDRMDEDENYPSDPDFRWPTPQDSGFASRGQRLGEIRQMETARGWIDDAQLREPLEIINLEDERAQESLGETLIRAGIIDSLDDPHFEGMFGFGNPQESNTILVFAPDTDAGVMDAASGNDYGKPQTRYLIPTKDGKWAIVELGGDYDGAPDGPPGYYQNYEIIGEPTTYTSAVRKIQALEREDVKPRTNRGLASRGGDGRTSFRQNRRLTGVFNRRQFEQALDKEGYDDYGGTNVADKLFGDEGLDRILDAEVLGKVPGLSNSELRGKETFKDVLDDMFYPSDTPQFNMNNVEIIVPDSAYNIYSDGSGNTRLWGVVGDGDDFFYLIPLESSDPDANPQYALVRGNIYYDADVDDYGNMIGGEIAKHKFEGIFGDKEEAETFAQEQIRKQSLWDMGGEGEGFPMPGEEGFASRSTAPSEPYSGSEVRLEVARRAGWRPQSGRPLPKRAERDSDDAIDLWSTLSPEERAEYLPAGEEPTLEQYVTALQSALRDVENERRTVRRRADAERRKEQNQIKDRFKRFLAGNFSRVDSSNLYPEIYESDDRTTQRYKALARRKANGMLANWRAMTQEQRDEMLSSYDISAEDLDPENIASEPESSRLYDLLDAALSRHGASSSNEIARDGFDAASEMYDMDDVQAYEDARIEAGFSSRGYREAPDEYELSEDELDDLIDEILDKTDDAEYLSWNEEEGNPLTTEELQKLLQDFGSRDRATQNAARQKLIDTFENQINGEVETRSIDFLERRAERYADEQAEMAREDREFRKYYGLESRGSKNASSDAQRIDDLVEESDPNRISERFGIESQVEEAARKGFITDEQYDQLYQMEGDEGSDVAAEALQGMLRAKKRQLIKDNNLSSRWPYDPNDGSSSDGLASRVTKYPGLGVYEDSPESLTKRGTFLDWDDTPGVSDEVDERLGGNSTEAELLDFDELPPLYQDQIIQEGIESIDRVAQPDIDLEAERDFIIEQWNDSAQEARSELGAQLAQRIEELEYRGVDGSRDLPDERILRDNPTMDELQSVYDDYTIARSKPRRFRFEDDSLVSKVEYDPTTGEVEVEFADGTIRSLGGSRTPKSFVEFQDDLAEIINDHKNDNDDDGSGLASRGPRRGGDDEGGVALDFDEADRAAFDQLPLAEQQRRTRAQQGRNNAERRELAIQEYADEWQYESGEEDGLGSRGARASTYEYRKLVEGLRKKYDSEFGDLSNGRKVQEEFLDDPISMNKRLDSLEEIGNEIVGLMKELVDSDDPDDQKIYNELEDMLTDISGTFSEVNFARRKLEREADDVRGSLKYLLGQLSEASETVDAERMAMGRRPPDYDALRDAIAQLGELTQEINGARGNLGERTWSMLNDDLINSSRENNRDLNELEARLEKVADKIQELDSGDRDDLTDDERNNLQNEIDSELENILDELVDIDKDLRDNFSIANQQMQEPLEEIDYLAEVERRNKTFEWGPNDFLAAQRLVSSPASSQVVERNRKLAEKLRDEGFGSRGGRSDKIPPLSPNDWRSAADNGTRMATGEGDSIQLWSTPTDGTVADRITRNDDSIKGYWEISQDPYTGKFLVTAWKNSRNKFPNYDDIEDYVSSGRVSEQFDNVEDAMYYTDKLIWSIARDGEKAFTEIVRENFDPNYRPGFNRPKGFESRGGRTEQIDVRGSRAVEQVTYDPAKEELLVVYNGNRGYIYEGVTRGEADALIDAPSKGSAINGIKATHSFRKATDSDVMDFDIDPAAMRQAEVDANWERLPSADKERYLRRATNAGIADGTGESADELLSAAKLRAMDDREMAMLEREAIGRGESSSRRIDVSSSSALNYVDYDEKTRTLSVEFRGRDGNGTGTLYNYQGVEPEVVDELERSDSRGATMRRIRDNYEFTTSERLPQSAYEGLASRGRRKTDPKLRNTAKNRAKWTAETRLREMERDKTREDEWIRRYEEAGNELLDEGVAGYLLSQEPYAPFDNGLIRERMAEIMAREILAGSRASGASSRRSKYESSDGRRINPARLHSDDWESLNEITDPEDRKKKIDRLIEFYGDRILVTPRKRRTATNQFRDGESGFSSRGGRPKSPKSGRELTDINGEITNKPITFSEGFPKDKMYKANEWLNDLFRPTSERRTAFREDALVDGSEIGKDPDKWYELDEDFDLSDFDTIPNEAYIEVTPEEIKRRVDDDIYKYWSEYNGPDEDAPFHIYYDRTNNEYIVETLGQLRARQRKYRAEEAVRKAGQSDDGFSSLGGRRSTEDMRKEFDDIIAEPKTLVRDNDISGVSDLIEYRENLIRARNRAGREMLDSRPVNREDDGYGENDYSKVRWASDASDDVDDQQLLEDYQDAIDAADEVLDTYRNLMDEQRAKVASVTRARLEAKDLREKIDDYNTDYVEEDFEASRDEHLSMIDDVEYFFDDESTGESYGDESVTHDLSHDDFVTREDRDLLERLKTEVQNAKTAEDFEQVRDQLSDVMRRLESDFEERYRAEETKLDYETPFVEDSWDLLNSEFMAAVNPKNTPSYLRRGTDEGGFFSRGYPTLQPAAPPQFYPYEDERNNRRAAGGAGAPAPDDDDDNENDENNGFRSRSDRRGRRRAPRQRWSEEDRRNFADRNFVRNRTRPGKRRQGPDAREWDGFASTGNDLEVRRSGTPADEVLDGSEVATDLPTSLQPTTFAGGEHGPGRDISMREMWKNYRRNNVGRRSRWLAENVTAEEFAEHVGIDVQTATDILSNRDPRADEVFIDDPYFADKLASAIGYGTGTRQNLFGFDPLEYIDESGNPARDIDSIEAAIRADRARREARMMARSSRRGKRDMVARGGAMTVADLERELQKIDPTIRLTNENGEPLSPGAMQRAVERSGIPIPWSVQPYRQIVSNGGVLSPNQMIDLAELGLIQSAPARADIAASEGFQWPGFAGLKINQIFDALSETLGISREEAIARKRTIEENLANARRGEREARNRKNIQKNSIIMSRQQWRQMAERLGLDADEFEKWFDTAPFTK